MFEASLVYIGCLRIACYIVRHFLKKRVFCFPRLEILGLEKEPNPCTATACVIG